MRTKLAGSGQLKKMKSCVKYLVSLDDTGVSALNFFLEERSRLANTVGLKLKKGQVIWRPRL